MQKYVISINDVHIFRGPFILIEPLLGKEFDIFSRIRAHIISTYIFYRHFFSRISNKRHCGNIRGFYSDS